MLFIAIICALWYKSASDRSTERIRKNDCHSGLPNLLSKGTYKSFGKHSRRNDPLWEPYLCSKLGNDSSPMGIYKFNTTDNPKAELVYRSEAGPIGANGGATLVEASALLVKRCVSGSSDKAI